MPRRDPNTGKFVSGGTDEDFVRYGSFSGSLTGTVPAADLGGGTVTTEIDGSAAEILDMTSYIDNDEVFEVATMTVSSTLSLPTTATAEGAAEAVFNVQTDIGGPGPGLRPVFYGGPNQEADDIVDVNSADVDDDSVLYRGRMTATPSIADTVNGLAAGSFDGQITERIPFFAEFGGGPQLDSDDEITVPTALAVDNVADHAIVVTHDVHLTGPVHDV